MLATGDAALQDAFLKRLGLTPRDDQRRLSRFVQEMRQLIESHCLQSIDKAVGFTTSTLNTELTQAFGSFFDKIIDGSGKMRDHLRQVVKDIQRAFCSATCG